VFIHLYFLYNGRVPYWFVNYVLYYKIPYYSGTLIYDSVYGHLFSTHGLFLSFCLSTLCTYSLIVYSELITFLCINLIRFLYWYQIDTQFLRKLHKIKLLYMFRASSAHPQEVNVVNCTCMQPLVFSFSAGGRVVPSCLPLASAQDGHLQRMRIPETAYTYS